METETAIAQASEKTVSKKWVKVQIYVASRICTGYAYCPHQRRLLDLLNGVPIGAVHTNEEFLPISEAKMCSVDGREDTVQPAYINKANILFVRAIEDGETRGLGGQAGHKPYPFVPKRSTGVKVYMPFYTLTGQMHYAKGDRIVDMLNSGLRFLPLTNVEIRSSTGSSESGVSFIAVNKAHILSLEELGVPLMGVPMASHSCE